MTRIGRRPGPDRRGIPVRYERPNMLDNPTPYFQAYFNAPVRSRVRPLFATQ